MDQQAVSKTNKTVPEGTSTSPCKSLVASPEHPLLAMRRSLGNRATGRLLQTKLKVGPTGDHFEQEADHVAEQVMRMPAAPPPEGPPAARQVQRLCKECDEEQDSIRRKALDNAQPSAAVPDERALHSGGDPLPTGVRTFYEERFGRDFGGVRLHTGPVLNPITTASARMPSLMAAMSGWAGANR